MRKAPRPPFRRLGSGGFYARGGQPMVCCDEPQIAGGEARKHGWGATGMPQDFIDCYRNPPEGGATEALTN